MYYILETKKIIKKEKNIELIWRKWIYIVDYFLLKSLPYNKNTQKTYPCSFYRIAMGPAQ